MDPQYFWNKLLHLPYIRSGVSLDIWLVKLMLGSVEIRTVNSGAIQVWAALISRLSCNRGGTRYHTRGVDDDGHVANHVETEQMVFTDNDVSNFVQLRGSVLLFWEQPGVNVGSSFPEEWICQDLLLRNTSAIFIKITMMSLSLTYLVLILLEVKKERPHYHLHIRNNNPSHLTNKWSTFSTISMQREEARI